MTWLSTIFRKSWRKRTYHLALKSPYIRIKYYRDKKSIKLYYYYFEYASMLLFKVQNSQDLFTDDFKKYKEEKEAA